MFKRAGLLFLLCASLFFLSCSGDSSSDKDKTIQYPSWLEKGIYVNEDRGSRIEFEEDSFILNDGINSLTVSAGEITTVTDGGLFSMTYKRSGTISVVTILKMGEFIFVTKSYKNEGKDLVTLSYGKHTKI